MTTIRLHSQGDISQIDTDLADVVITKNYLGVGFVTDDNETLSVAHRDSGFELLYSAVPGGPVLLISMNAGQVKIVQAPQTT